jgi:AcrR family transcriptional regulator
MSNLELVAQAIDKGGHAFLQFLTPRWEKQNAQHSTQFWERHLKGLLEEADRATFFHRFPSVEAGFTQSVESALGAKSDDFLAVWSEALQAHGRYASQLVLCFKTTPLHLRLLVDAANAVGLQTDLRGRFDKSLLREIELWLRQHSGAFAIVVGAPPFASSYLFGHRKEA